jgi:hypothetical protein
MAKTTHEVYFKGEDVQLDVYLINGTKPGPTLLLMGGIQGDEPGGYLAADLYADISLQQGNMIVIPRANLLSIVSNNRGLHGDMNRKFAVEANPTDRESEVVATIKKLMKKSDFFLNLHDGSGFYSNTWESPMRNPLRFGQSIIADAAAHTLPDGKQISMEAIVQRVLAKVNRQIPVSEHHFHFNNHRTLAPDTKHKEQRLSATFHALTRVGIPAFGIETSKSITDFSTRVKYQTMVINAFLDQCGIIPETPKIYLESPSLRFLVVSINGQVPIVVKSGDVVRAEPNDVLRIAHVEANYTRGLTARVVGRSKRLDDVNHDVPVPESTVIEVRKDRFLMASIPVEVGTRGTNSGKKPAADHRAGTGGSGTKGRSEPAVRYFCVRINDKAVLLEPSERLNVMSGDLLTLMDPRTNLGEEDERRMKIDLRGFQMEASSDPQEDRGHCIDTAVDLQPKYARQEADMLVFPLQAKLGRTIIAESYVAVTEPKLEYLVLRGSQGIPFVAYAGDILEVPGPGIVRILDLKTNAPDNAPLFINLAGSKVKWARTGSAAIDPSKLSPSETPLEITRNGRSLGKIWLKQGMEFRLSRGSVEPTAPVVRVKY